MKCHFLNGAPLRAALIVAGLALGLGLDTQVIAASTPPPSETHAAAPNVSDGQINARVKETLAGVPSLKGADIAVATSEGVVTLSGTVGDPHAKFAAANAAITVEGVRILDDELKVRSGNKMAAETRTGRSGAKHSASDDRITADVKQLLAVSIPKRYKVDAKTEHGVVYLSGEVMDGNAIERLRGMVAKVDGVKQVNTLGLDAPFVVMAY